MWTLLASNCDGVPVMDLPASRATDARSFSPTTIKASRACGYGLGRRALRALHAQYLTAGANIRNPPNNFEWALEMQVEDLDGNVLRIGSDPEEDEPLGVWRDADGIRRRHLGMGKYEHFG